MIFFIFFYFLSHLQDISYWKRVFPIGKREYSLSEKERKRKEMSTLAKIREESKRDISLEEKREEKRDISLEEKKEKEIALQIILHSLNRDKIVYVRKDPEKRLASIRQRVEAYLTKGDILVTGPISEIRDLKDMSEEDKVNEVLISLLLNEKEYIQRENPTSFYLDLVEKLTLVVREFKKGNPVEIPIYLYQDLGIDIFAFTVANKWNFRDEGGEEEEKEEEEKEEKRDEKREKEKMREKREKTRGDAIESILNKFQPAKDKKIRDIVKKELSVVDTQSLLKWNKMGAKELNEIIEEWSDYRGELSTLFDTIETREKEKKKKEKREKKVEKVEKKYYDLEAFKEFKKGYFEKEENGKRGTCASLRDKYAEVMLDLFQKYGNPRNFVSKKEMSYNYIRKTLLPFLMFFNKHHPWQREKYTYGMFIYSLFKDQYRIKKREYPSEIIPYMSNFMNNVN